MRRKFWLAAATAAIAAATVAAVVLVPRFEARRDAQRFGVVERYCTECHNDAELSGEISFEGMSVDEVRSTPSSSKPPS